MLVVLKPNEVLEIRFSDGDPSDTGTHLDQVLTVVYDEMVEAIQISADDDLGKSLVHEMTVARRGGGQTPTFYGYSVASEELFDEINAEYDDILDAPLKPQADIDIITAIHESDQLARDATTVADRPEMGLERPTVKEKVAEIIGEVLGVDGLMEIDARATIDSIDGDSLDALEIVMAVEEHFAVSLSDVHLDGIRTFGDLTAAVESLRGQ